MVTVGAVESRGAPNALSTLKKASDRNNESTDMVLQVQSTAPSNREEKKEYKIILLLAI